ncbi:MAG: aminotransferase class I/II-fold pyridoxal phosphate-dependent enzyme, partial [Gammaproteobacteria bacterium]|nr:aminotransferase class I/II-fold pyridoxal phosphate-dependent enzyme [Gammaproteobacteria bacterium]
MSADFSNKGIKTKAIHGGENHDTANQSSAPDLVMSSTFRVDREVSFSANKLDADAPYVYTRWANPTTDQLEEKLAILEQGEACIAFASGMAATTGVLLGHLSKGDHLIICDTNYPGTAEVARQTLPRFDIDVTAVHTSDPANVSNALRNETRMIWLETPSNPLLNIADIAAIAKIARNHGALLVVDSTFATPIATRPLELGADLVVHSLTKYIGGHGDAMGGSVCGARELLDPLRTEALSHFGGVMSPFNAWLIMRGMATLPIRMREHATNAMTVAQYLENHPRVETVIYPGLKSHPQHELAVKQMDSFSGMLSFRVANNKDVASRMMSEFEIIHYAVSLGHHRSLMYLLQTDDLAETSFGLEGAELEKYRAVA